MHHLATLSYTKVVLHWHEALSGSSEARARQLRGALAAAFAGDDRFHQHDDRGRLLYRYPRIQYRWYQGYGVVVGWEQGAEVLAGLPWLDVRLSLGGDEVQVCDALIETAQKSFYADQKLHHYRLVTPVMLLNQANYRRYQSLSSEEQAHERDRLLVAQILTALRGFHIDFNTQLYAAFTQVRPCSCSYKQQTLLGLRGQFISNAVLPADFALGHAVSHGYGWVQS